MLTIVLTLLVINACICSCLARFVVRSVQRSRYQSAAKLYGQRPPAAPGRRAAGGAPPSAVDGLGDDDDDECEATEVYEADEEPRSELSVTSEEESPHRGAAASGRPGRFFGLSAELQATLSQAGVP